MTTLLQPPHKLRRILKDYPVVIVPGLRNSDENHWQTHWHTQLPGARRVSLDDWSTPDLDKWKLGIKQALQGVDRPAIVIAHSFGTLASASLAAEYPNKIAGLFLVAPADPDKFGIRDRLPQTGLPVLAKIVASSDDPWLTEIKAAELALQWGADYVRFRGVGHINSASGLGFWHDGVEELQNWLKSHRALAA